MPHWIDILLSLCPSEVELSRAVEGTKSKVTETRAEQATLMTEGIFFRA